MAKQDTWICYTVGKKRSLLNMTGNTRDKQRKKQMNSGKRAATGDRRPASSYKKQQQRRKRVIRVWTNRILAILIAGLIILGIVWGIKSLFGSTKQLSIYGLPDYVTEEYLTINKYSRPGIQLQEVNNIVIHYTGNPGTSAEANRNYFNGLSEQAAGSELYASSNFIVGLDGEIIACVPIDEVAYASNHRNTDTLSIETCHPDETGAFNEETYNSLVKLTAWLCNQYELDSEAVIRHYDVSGKNCPKYFVEDTEAWAQFKADVQAALDLLAEEETTTIG